MKQPKQQPEEIIEDGDDWMDDPTADEEEEYDILDEPDFLDELSEEDNYD